MGGATLQALETVEIAQRRLHPATIETLRALLQPVSGRLEVAVAEFREAEAPVGLEAFHARNADTCPTALEALQQAALSHENIFAALMETAKVASLGQISGALYAVGGQYRRNM